MDVAKSISEGFAKIISASLTVQSGNNTLTTDGGVLYYIHGMMKTEKKHSTSHVMAQVLEMYPGSN
jgi:hypothetical protein